MIKLENVAKTYDNGKRALDDISLSFVNYGLHIITGPSGSGKSTLLNLISLLDPITEGRILYQNKEISNLYPKEKDRFRRNVCSFIFQEYNLIEDMTVLENLEICNYNEGKIDQILNQVGLAEYKRTLVKKLSGGERQRVAIARALVKDTKIILADEPTGSLDELNGRKIMDLLKQISKDHLVILVTHNSTFANSYADRLIKIEEGKIISDTLVNKTEKIPDSFDIPYFRIKTRKVVRNFFFTNLRNSYWKTLNTVTLFTFFILVILLFIAFMTINPDQTYKKFIEENHYRYLNIGYDSRMQIGYYRYLTLDEEIKAEALPYIDDYVYLTFTDQTVFISKIFVVEENHIEYPVRKNEIVITDYVADIIINQNGTDEFKSHADFINKEIIYRNRILRISNIAKTNYQTDSLEEETGIDNYYQTVFMNIDTIKEIWASENLSFDIFYFHKRYLADSDNTNIILEDSLSDTQIILSQDLESKIMQSSVSARFASGNWKFEDLTLDCQIIQAEVDSSIENTLFVSEEVYSLLKDYSLGGGVIVNINDNSLQWISKLRFLDYYFHTPYITSHLSLLKTKSILLIPLIILSLGSFVVLTVLFHSFLMQRISFRKRDYIILKSQGNNSIINKIISWELYVPMLLSFFLALILFYWISLPIDKLLRRIFLNTTKIEIILPMIAIFILILVISFYIKYSFLRKLRLTRELDVIK